VKYVLVKSVYYTHQVCSIEDLALEMEKERWEGREDEE
jgi:hypothetical protein